MINNTKTLVRQQIKKNLLLLDKCSKMKQAKVVTEKLLNLNEFKTSERISVYLSTENELSTEFILNEIFRLNKKCFVPRCKRNNMEMVKLSSLEDGMNLPLNRWGIREPLLKDTRENALETGGLELIIVPGLAFTKCGQRLGYGAGYYDRFLQRIKALNLPKPKTVALAFKEQILDEVPTESHDEKMDLVLYDDT